MPPKMPDRNFGVKGVAADYAQTGVEAMMHTRHNGDMTRLAAIRKAQGLTQQQLAEKIGANQGTISKIERGVGNPTQDILVRIASALDVELIEIFDIGDLQSRALAALARMPDEKRRAALMVLEAMAAQDEQ